MPPDDTLPVLTWHSISPGSDPTAIPADVFGMQIETLAECGRLALDGDGFLAWREGRLREPGRSVMLTFDDAYDDFATTALPILRRHGFACTVFVPTARVGRAADWNGAAPRPLMSWPAIEALARDGVEFGGHGTTHRDLTRLDASSRREEIDRCARDLAEHLGRRPRFFAAPYGRTGREVATDVARTYRAAFGTRMDRAAPTDDPFDVPRIDMHYFRQRRRWRDFLMGASGYFAARRALRQARVAATGLLGGNRHG